MPVYAVVELHNSGKGEPPVPRIRGKYDVYVVPWKDLGSILHDYADTLPLAQGANITITIQDWTEEQRDAFLEPLGG